MERPTLFDDPPTRSSGRPGGSPRVSVERGCDPTVPRDRFYVFDHARVEDKSTSIEASRAAKLTSGSMMAKIHADLVAFGPSTADQSAARNPEWDKGTVSRRLTDLERTGRVRDTGRTRATRRGRQATVYEAVVS